MGSIFVGMIVNFIVDTIRFLSFLFSLFKEFIGLVLIADHNLEMWASFNFLTNPNIFNLIAVQFSQTIFVFQTFQYIFCYFPSGWLSCSGLQFFYSFKIHYFFGNHFLLKQYLMMWICNIVACSSVFLLIIPYLFLYKRNTTILI